MYTDVVCFSFMMILDRTTVKSGIVAFTTPEDKSKYCNTCLMLIIFVRNVLRTQLKRHADHQVKAETFKSLSMSQWSIFHFSRSGFSS